MMTVIKTTKMRDYGCIFKTSHTASDKVEHHRRAVRRECMRPRDDMLKDRDLTPVY
ncbi:MAG: hypothetical protein ACLU8S_03095 [Coprococcus phoceensis]